MQKPFMFLISMTGSGVPTDPETRQVAADIRSIYDRLPPSTRLWMFIRGANHFLYSDDGSVLASHLILRILQLFRILKIDGRRQLAITTHCVHTFLDAHLKQASASPLNLSLPLYPELEVVH